MQRFKSPFTRAAIVIAALVLEASGAMAYPTGVTGRSITGCTCHPSSNGVLTFMLSGPPSLANNATGTYTLTFVGGTGTAMGVDITVSAGTLGLVTTANLQLVSNEISHTDVLPSRTVQFTVKAPASGGSLTIYYAGVSDFANWSKGNTAQPLPIQLTSFTVALVPGSAVRLAWSTLSEVNDFGFRVQRRKDGSDEFTDLPGAFIDGHGTTSVARQYSYVDRTAGPGSWGYRLAQVDLDGTEHFTDAIALDVNADAAREVPGTFSLPQNFPNPFNPSTTIRYGLPRGAFVTLNVYNALGQEVATLVSGWQDAGYREVRFDAGRLASGVYLYRLKAGDFVESKKFVILR